MNKLITSLLIGLAVVLNACSSFLDLSPEHEVSPNNFFKTEADFDQALHAAYNVLRSVGPDFYMGEMRSDNTHYEYAPNNRGTVVYMRENIADFVDDASNEYTNAFYFDTYRGISRANIVVSRLETAELSETAHARILGQALFLRAFHYFKLVRYFGGVPLYLEEVRNDGDAFRPRASVAEVYTQIISDATRAVSLLEAPKSFPQTGYATKGAATMLLADVYAHRNEHARAEELLLTLSSMGYDLLDRYADVFSTAHKNSRESLFEVQFMEGLTAGMQSTFIYNFLPRCLNTAPITGVATNNTSNNGGGWNTPTPNMIEAYEPGDTRLDASIGIAEGTYNASYYFNLQAGRSIIGYEAPEGKVGVPYVKKFLNPHSNPNNTNDNWPVYRYADALLLLAEVQNEQGKISEALVHLNRVRNRAIPDASPVQVTDQAALRDLILKERRVELAFENHRWFDLLRSGKAVEVMSRYGKEMKEIHAYLLPETYRIESYRLLFPLPFSEVGVNTVLDQNDGY